MHEHLLRIGERIEKSNDIEITIRKLFIDKLKESLNNTNETKILSISTGDGVWDYLLFSNFKNIANITATDIVSNPVNPEDIKMLQQMGDWRFVRLEPEQKLPFSDNVYDLVMHHDVIEHVEHPYFFLEEQYRVLKTEGILIFETPNLLRPVNLLRMLTGKLDFPRKIGSNTEIGDYVHIQEFTLWQLKTMLKEIGFRNINITASFLGITGLKISDYPKSQFGRIFCHNYLVSGIK